MLTRIKEDPEWLGEPTDVNTTGANTDGPLIIHRPAQGATSNLWYSVTAGTQVGIFASWYVPHTLCIHLL